MNNTENMRKLMETVTEGLGLGRGIKKAGVIAKNMAMNPGQIVPAAKMDAALRRFMKDGDETALSEVLMSANDQMVDAVVAFGYMKSKEAQESGKTDKSMKFEMMGNIANLVVDEREGVSWDDEEEPVIDGDDDDYDDDYDYDEDE